jgi:hypothetical protein
MAERSDARRGAPHRLLALSLSVIRDQQMSSRRSRPPARRLRRLACPAVRSVEKFRCCEVSSSTLPPASSLA